MSLTATGTQLPWHDPGAADEDKCCCGLPVDCCLYPQPGGLDNYAEGILVGGVAFSPDLSDPYHPFYQGSTGSIVVNESRNEWQFIPTGSSMEDDTYFSPCLISTFTGGMGSIEVVDQFSGTYEVAYTRDGLPMTDTLTRASLCCWVGANSCPKIQVCYSGSKWAISVADSEDGFLNDGNKNTGQDESSPVGSYTDDGNYFTVCGEYIAIGDVVIS